MRRIALHIGIALLTFVCGVVANSLVIKFFGVPVSPTVLQAGKMPRFVATGPLLEPDYHIYRYRRSTSNDDEEINFYADFRSAQVSQETFESNATSSASMLIEYGIKFDKNGHQIGKRGVSVSKYSRDVRIFWTDGDTFWTVQTSSLKIAREFEESDVVHSITMSHKGLHTHQPDSCASR